MYRRTANRFEVNTSAVITTNHTGQERLMLKDISCRGAGIIGYQPFALAERVSISFQIPAFFNQPISKDAKVAWSKKINGKLWEAGLDFGLDNILNLLPLQ